MSKEAVKIVSASIAAAIIGGLAVFVFSGGIPELAKDVGESGAIGVALYMQLIYSLILAIGVYAYIRLARDFINFPSPSFLSAILASVVLSGLINLLGILGVTLELGVALMGLVLGSVVLNALTALGVAVVGRSNG